MKNVMALCWAASQGDLTEIRRLVANDVDLNGCDYDGRTPLHLAASEGQDHVVRFLLAKSVVLDPKDRWGMTPLDNAKKECHYSTIKLLEDHVLSKEC